MTVLIVVADAGRARFFETDLRHGAYKEVDDRVDPAARVPQAKLASDEPGMQAMAGNPATHGLQEKITPKQQEEIRFAGEVVDQIRRTLDSNNVEKFLLAAPPRFLGLLRNAMSDRLARALAGDLDKDLTQHSVDDIRAHMRLVG
ncbi:MAG: host attachment protein [Pseudomonadota bacterium]